MDHKSFHLCLAFILLAFVHAEDKTVEEKEAATLAKIRDPKCNFEFFVKLI